MKILTSFILIAVSVASFFFYMQPTYSSVQNLTAQKDLYAGVLQKAKDLSAKRDQILAQYNAVSPDDINRLKSAIPDTFDSVTVAKYVNTIASKYGLVVKGIKFTVPQIDQRVISADSSNQPVVQTMNFNFAGTYTQFASFIKDVESSLLLMDVTKIAITDAVKGKVIADIIKVN